MNQSNNIIDPPIPKTKNYNIASFSVSVINLILFTSVSLSVIFFGDDKAVVDTKLITLKDDDYVKWNNDDQYIIDYVKNYITTEPL